MKQREDYFHPPRAAEIIRMIVRAFEMDHPALTDKTAQRYFAEGRVSTDAKKYVLKALCEALVDERVFPDPVGEQVSPDSRDEIVQILLLHIERAVDDWESMLGSIRSVAPRAEQGDLAVFAILRLVTIDLAVRNAALHAIRGEDGFEFVRPYWIREQGMRDLLRELQSASDLDQVTRHSISVELSVDQNTVDNWFDGKFVPSNDNLKSLADVFAKATSGSDPTEFHRILLRTAGLYRLISEIRKFIGERRLTRLAERYEKYTQQAFQVIRPSSLRIKPVPVDLDLMMMWGTQREDSDYVLKRLHDAEDDLLWQTEIRWLSRLWFARMMQVFHGLSRHFVRYEDVNQPDGSSQGEIAELMDTVNELGQVPIRSSDIDADYPPDFRAYLAESALLEGYPQISIAHMRNAVAEVPDHPGYHQYLGFALEGAGAVSEAIREYELSYQLDPEDANPLMYIGMAHYYSGAMESAVEYLTRAAKHLGESNETLNLFLGMTLRELRRYPEALKVFEAMVEHTPDHAWALDWAAECAIRSGDRRKGRQYATRAWRLGQPVIYDMIQKGQI